MFRHLMSSKVRSNAGCWTCRLRRKKCDEKRPVCDSCGALEITCYFHDEKPDWMDGGPKQKAMAEKIKAQVKKQASQRRDRKYMDMLEAGTRNVTLQTDNPQQQHHDAAMSAASDTDPPSSHDFGSTPASSNTSGASPPDMPWHSHFSVPHEDPSSSTGASTEIHFIMIYLDYVFPHLFPFYRPPILAGGRGWVLDVLQSNKSVWHTAVSLTSYFFSIVMANGAIEHEECTNRMVHQLQSQLEMGLRELQREMSAVNHKVSCAGVRDRLLVLQAILQMLIFEVSTSNKDHWKMHLDAAITMYQQILPKPEQWGETLEALYSYRWPPPEMGVRRPFSTHQAALRFFTANVLYIDVMSSITLEQAPRLQKYQDNIMPGCKAHTAPEEVRISGSLFMEDYVGLHNWVVQIIGDISALAAWKKQQKKANSLSINELVQRGKVMEDAIKGGLGVFEVQAQLPGPYLDPIMSVVSNPSHPHDINTKQAPGLAVNNQIWLQAALTYLHVVISGWQPSCPEIRYSVGRMTELLTALPSNTCLRTLVWPFCIAGCLSPPEDEDKYRAMVERMGPISVFGTVREALEVMEKVWSKRDQIDESWDMAKCLQILGHEVLLI
ncbi:hypothetical protein NW762_000019 [Fusarium torreyae]|uniref:Zn(2)-C6 fungal-type domain-containing protein n=1 Tax=Fusarium torreyae TaxID=1237075 RepID=A0A9W8SFJ1_9HYPO|nr:hypothetical protein NW762_000019 [Fusarium torreyae]